MRSLSRSQVIISRHFCLRYLLLTQFRLVNSTWWNLKISCRWVQPFLSPEVMNDWLQVRNEVVVIANPTIEKTDNSVVKGFKVMVTSGRCGYWGCCPMFRFHWKYSSKFSINLLVLLLAAGLESTAINKGVIK